MLSKGTQQLVPRRALQTVKPSWHPPWKLMRVISGHLGWVRCIAVEPSNEWFATGSGDRTIKVGWKKSSTHTCTYMYTCTYMHTCTYMYTCTYMHTCTYMYTCTHQLWELASGRLKLTLTGHISTVRALVVSPRQPYLFSAGEDKQVKCWDLEYNKASLI